MREATRHQVVLAGEVGACVGLAATVLLTRQPLTAHWDRIAAQDLGALALGAATGAALVHLWVDRRRGCCVHCPRPALR